MRIISVTALLVLVGLSGCLDGEQPIDVETPYKMEGDWSTPRQPALYDKLPSWQAMVPVRDGVEMALGIFLPDIAACEASGSDAADACELPVVVDAGPYYTDKVLIDKGRPQWVEWLVPRGYAVIQMALRGTGESGGCMGYKSPQDANDISDVVDWIVDQPWSNGNVGVAGRSYDGTSAWAAAASGNPHVKTIVPISGAVDAPHLYFKNGTTEVRALIPHIPIYWASYALGTAGSDPTYRGTDVVANVCPEVVQPHVEGPMTAFTGDASSDYWQSRDLTDSILDNYGGSAWVIHGMVDWNVNPSQAVPFLNEMIDADIPTRAWLGQWAHAYPDHMPEHINVRWDWSDQLVSWFDYYLREAGDAPWLGVEVEDDSWRWRAEERYPPLAVDATYEAATDITLGPGSDGTASWTADSSGIAAGLPEVALTVTPTTATGGSVAVQLLVTHDGVAREAGWGVLNLMNRGGGNTESVPLIPGQEVTVRVQFEPMDAVIHAGDELQVRVTRAGIEDIAPSWDQSPLPVSHISLSLPLVERTDFIQIPLTPDDSRAP